MIGMSIILAAALCSQHYRESKHDPAHAWPNIKGPSPAAKAKHAAMHAAAEQSRKDFDEALRILHSTPLPLCPCFNRPGAKGFE